MKSDLGNEQPYRESKEHALSHYFDDLLPTDSEPEELPEDTPIAPVTAQASSNDDEDKKPTTTEQAYVDHHLNSMDSASSEKSASSPNTLSPSPSTSLKPLVDEPVVSSVNAIVDGSAYEAHKQKLEKMLQQLTPVKSLITLAPKEPAQAAIAPAVPTDNETAKTPQTTVPDVDSSEPVLSSTPSISSRWLDNGRPHWAQNPFDILLIDVSGLKLAVPLVALGHIEPIAGELTPLFGQSQWFLGLQKTPFGNIKTIDTAQYVMPEKTINEGQKNYNFVISINGMNWGLAVDAIDQPILIDPESIRWRAKRSNRPWMAGTVKDHMCVLLDIPVMGEILLKEDQNHRNNTGE